MMKVAMNQVKLDRTQTSKKDEGIVQATFWALCVNHAGAADEELMRAQTFLIRVVSIFALF